MKAFDPRLSWERLNQRCGPYGGTAKVVVVEGYGQIQPRYEEVCAVTRAIGCEHINLLILEPGSVEMSNMAKFAEEVLNYARAHKGKRCILISESHPAFQVIKGRVGREEISVLSGYGGKYPHDEYAVNGRSAALTA